MNLNDEEVEAAYLGLADCVRLRKARGVRVPVEVEQLRRRLESRITLARPRHEVACPASDPSQSEVWIGSMAVSDMLGMPVRSVQRHADEIGAQHIGRRLFFRESDVIAYAERMAAEHG